MNVRESLRKRLLKESDEKRMSMDIAIPDDIRKIHTIFKSKGKQLFVVGGSIRDALLGKPPKDWDLATDATPDEVIRMLKFEPFIENIVETGKSFGVINALTANDEYEIATFRKDIGSADGRRPNSVEFADIATDVMRRDLTINALFYDLDTNEVVDLVGGMEDLRNGIVRTVGDASERFDEDKLRVLRAIRFAGRFGSKVDDKIDQILSKGVDMSQISGERIRDEFIKGIRTSKSTKHFLGLMGKYNLFQQIFPNMTVTNNFLESNDPDLTIAALLSDKSNLGKIVKQLNKLKYPTQEAKNIDFLATLPIFNPNLIKEFKDMQAKTDLTDEQIIKFANSIGLDSKLINGLLNFELSVSGDEVMSKYGIKGKAVGDMIKKLEIEKFNSTIT